MRSAPPVLVPVGRFVRGWYITLALAASSALLWLALATQGRRPDDGLVHAIWPGVLWLGMFASAWWWSRREFMPPGELSWDGQDWWYGAQGAQPRKVTLTLCWDAGAAMLLGLRDADANISMCRYIWLTSRRTGRQWHGLRCAVHARDTL